MSLIGRFEHLPKRPKSDEARPLLEKIASQVKPIMTKRQLKVGTLAEFLPSDPSLLGNNMNRGQRINLRLRPPGEESTFYDYEQLVLVMLHELTHNEFGPHDAKFYNLLGELEEEYYELKRKGFSGDGFHSNGNHLAGIKRDEYAGRLTGLQAAERRLAIQRRIGKGGVLGGKGTAGRSVREVMAEAAERRIRDDKACSAEGSREVDEEVRKAAEESIGIDAIDLTGPDGEDEAVPVRSVGSVETGQKRPDPSSSPVSKPPEKDRAVRVKMEPTSASVRSSTSLVKPNANHPVTSRPGDPSRPSGTSRQPPTSARKAPIRPIIRKSPSPQVQATAVEWACPTCTLLNPLSRLSCDACATERPASVSRSADGWGTADGSGRGTNGDRDGYGEGVFGVQGKGSGLGIAEGWFCGVCGEGPVSWERWSCEGCGVVRSFG